MRRDAVVFDIGRKHDGSGQCAYPMETAREQGADMDESQFEAAGREGTEAGDVGRSERNLTNPCPVISVTELRFASRYACSQHHFSSSKMQ